jgi:hypothetical protein
VTFADRYTLEVGGERVELAWHGPNHTPDNIYIHFPGHDTLMFIDVVNAGWVPIYNLNLSEDVIGYMGAPDIALSYPWTHLISGHVGRLATRDDVAVLQQYIADIVASSREALASVNPVPFYMDAGENVWLGIKGIHHDDHVPDHAVTSPRQRAERAGSPLRSCGKVPGLRRRPRHYPCSPPATEAKRVKRRRPALPPRSLAPRRR